MKNKQITGIVTIGRNEGERLRRCLESCQGLANIIVYVDSGSVDGSVDLARSFGVETVDLDLSTPFTAARARNEGAKRLLELNPAIKYIQFIDGDCEFSENWLVIAAQELEMNQQLSIVCGRLREKFPEVSIYNRICDIEWNTPVGEVDACGGIFMIKADIFRQTGGFNGNLTAGEEPELCLRIRHQGGKILRLEQTMAWHDAAMTRFSQWWTRSVRCGHAYAEGMSTHWGGRESYCVKESLRIWFWALFLPFSVSVLALSLSFWWCVLFLVYPYSLWRTKIFASHLTADFGDRWIYAFVCMFSKWPELVGQIKFWKKRTFNIIFNKAEVRKNA